MAGTKRNKPGNSVDTIHEARMPNAVLIVILAAMCGSLNAQTYRILYKFTGSNDGANPAAALATLTPPSSPPVLFGTTVNGGIATNHGYGTVFQLTFQGSTWSINTLYSFAGAADGANPPSGVTIGSGGILYGTTSAQNGGNCSLGGLCGTVYDLWPPTPPATTWTKYTIHTFNSAGDGTDGSDPYGNVTLDSTGDVYGTTRYGGKYAQCSATGCTTMCGTGSVDDPGCYCGNSGCGTVYKLAQGVTPWSESRLWDFGNNSDGREPYSSVAFDSNGDLYGTTVLGGTLNCIQSGGAPNYYDDWGCGTVFELMAQGSSWGESIIHSFTDGTDGSYAFAGLTYDSGNSTFYGATANAYPSGGQYGGTIFQVASGSLSTIYNLPGAIQQVSGPHSQLVMDSHGNLYGTTSTGGTYGSVFELPYSSGWGTLITLHQFSGSDGAYPIGGLVLDGSGNLYGTTYSGVTDGSGCSTALLAVYPLGCGVVYEITP